MPISVDGRPGIGAAKPVIGLLVLPAVLDGLPEHSVLVPEAVADGRQLHRGHRVEEARGETPEPAVAEPGVGLFLEQAEPVERRSLDDVVHEGTEHQIRDVVGQRAADQEFHREVIDALGIEALVGLLRAHPALREDVADGACEGLVPIARAAGRRVDHVVEEQVPLVERVRATRELHRPAAVLLAQRRHGGRGGRRSRRWTLLWAHRRTFSRRRLAGAGLTRRSPDISSQKRITGSERSCSYPIALRLAVPRRKYRPTPGGRPSQRAANTRRKCPLEKSSVLPPMSRTRPTTRSARAGTSWECSPRAGSACRPGWAGTSSLARPASARWGTSTIVPIR